MLPADRHHDTDPGRGALGKARTDPLAPLLELPGVADAVARAREALVELHNHPVNRRGWASGAAEASLRAARASAALDGAPLDLDATTVSGDAAAIHDREPGSPDGAPDTVHPVLAGAVRVAEDSGRLLAVWRRSPLQALARLHVVAAADLVIPERRGDELGRPRGGAGTSARLSLLADLVTGGTIVAAPVLVAVVHGELLALAPFPSANGVVARAAARLTAVATGLDPKGLAVPEVGHLRHAAEYRTAAAGFATGSRDGLAAWLLHCCAQWEAGAREGLSIAESRHA
jgi:hypothetical protein